MDPLPTSGARKPRRKAPPPLTPQEQRVLDVVIANPHLTLEQIGVAAGAPGAVGGILRKIRISRRRRLTPMQLRVIAALVDNPDRTLRQIGAAAGGLEQHNVGRILRSQNVQVIMREMMEITPGLRRVELLQKLKEGLGATKIERFADKGFVRTTKTDVDYRTRGFYLELACDLNGAKTQRVELSGAGGTPLIPDSLMKVLESMDEAALRSLIAKIAAE